jgi:hypothetical protein
MCNCLSPTDNRLCHSGPSADWASPGNVRPIERCYHQTFTFAVSVVVFLRHGTRFERYYYCSAGSRKLFGDNDSDVFARCEDSLGRGLLLWKADFEGSKSILHKRDNTLYLHCPFDRNEGVDFSPPLKSTTLMQKLRFVSRGNNNTSASPRKF